jgi:hypothetical protein
MTPPDWMGPATDLLKTHMLDEAAGRLAAEPSLRAKFETAVGLLESILGANVGERWFVPLPEYRRMLELIAEERGESPEQTSLRLRRPFEPPDPSGDPYY